MDHLTKAVKKRMQQEFREWLIKRNQPFTHGITLATHDTRRSVDRCISDLVRWDARMNRKIVGPKWKKRPDERICWTAFIEGFDRALHWHLLFFLEDLSNPCRQVLWSEGQWIDLVDPLWQGICPSGTSKVEKIRDGGALDYATKHLHRFDSMLYWQDSIFLKRL